MKNRIPFLTLTTACFLTIVAGISSIRADELDRIRERGELIWGADKEGGGPFVFPADDDPNRLIGFEVEIAELIARHLGVRAKFQQGQWDKLPDLLDRGDLDVVLNGFEWNAGRAERYGTSIPYYIYELQLLVKASDSEIQSWDDLVRVATEQQRKVSLLGGAAAEEYANRVSGGKLTLALFEGVTDAMRATELGTDDIVANVQDLPIWNFYHNDFPGLRAAGPPTGQGFYVALTRKSDAALLREINSAMLAAFRDGRMRQIFERYGMWNDTQARRGLETSDDGGFRGQMPSEEKTTEGEQPATASSTSIRGMDVVWKRGGFLVRAAFMTVVLSVTSMPIAIGIGLVMALMRMYGPWYCSAAATSWVELVRGTPLVLQLYVIYFLVPEVIRFLVPGSEITISAFWSAVAGLAVNYSAYEAEIYRAGLQAIPHGQMEAALSLGMTRRLAIRRILIPQATRIVIPPMTNDFIALFKDTAVCSVITVVELSKEYYIQARNTGAIVELGLLTALLYLAMSYPLSIVAGRLEKRLARETRT